jgi:hypothetical protein
VDMANVQQLYRILAFFVLAVVLGLVARTYQRFRSSANKECVVCVPVGLRLPWGCLGDGPEFRNGATCSH